MASAHTGMKRCLLASSLPLSAQRRQINKSAYNANQEGGQSQLIYTAKDG